MDSYLKWILTSIDQNGIGHSKKICDHITILLGRILNQKVSRISDQSDEVENE